MTNPQTFDKLGRVQRQVMVSLSSQGEATVQHLAYDWPGLTDSGVYSAIMGLGRRGLVDVARWEGRSRKFCLTRKGDELMRDVDRDELEGES